LGETSWAGLSQTVFGGNRNPEESGGILSKNRNSCPTGIPAKNSCESGKKQEFLLPPPKPRSCVKFLWKTQKKRKHQESWQEWLFWSKKIFLKTGICNLGIESS
jgi:hypothetical protein